MESQIAVPSQPALPEKARPAEPRRLVRFEYCISMVAMTMHRESELIELSPGESCFLRSLPYNLITLTLGWWGVPWGLLLTPGVLWRNLQGGQAWERSDGP